MEVINYFLPTLLNLPALPANLEARIIEAANLIPLDEPGRQWIEDFHNNKINAVSHVYGRSNTFLTGDLNDAVTSVYVDYFKEPISIIVGKLSNTQEYSFASSPPHCDRLRYVAINYLLQAGGNNVQTCIYKQPRKLDDLSAAENERYENLEINAKICIPEKKWHAYDVQFYHSVERIETSRLLLSILVNSNPTVEIFKQKYYALLNTTEPLCES